MNRAQRRHPMQNGNGNGFGGVIDLKPKPKLIKFTCRASHEFEASGPWHIQLPAGNGQYLSSDPVCPFCLYQYLCAMFPAWPADLTIEEAVEQGLLKSYVLPPAPTEGAEV